MNYILAILIAAIVLIFGLAWLNDSQANKIQAQAQAQAIIIRAESQANTAMMIAAMPVALVLLGGGAGMICAISLLIFAVRWQPRQVIEQRVILQITPGQPRRELWQALSAAQDELLLQEPRRDDTKTIIAIR